MRLNAQRKPRHFAGWFISVFLSLVGAGFSQTVSAYVFPTCETQPMRWQNLLVVMSISPTSYPAGSIWDTKLQNAMWHWNNVKGSNIGFLFNRTNGSRGQNDLNEIYLSSQWNDEKNALAITGRRYICARDWFGNVDHWIQETDIRFNPNQSWNTSSYDPTVINNPSFEATAVHELGHVLGLDHEDRWLATMNSLHPSGGPLGQDKEWDPLPDDRSGVRHLYSDTTAETDIAASAMKHELQMVNGVDMATAVSVAAPSPFLVYAGNAFTIEYTFHNLGTARATFEVGYFLSLNDYISTSDIWLDTDQGAWADPGYSGTYTKTLYVPADTPRGTYVVRVLLDPNDALDEANEANNWVTVGHISVLRDMFDVAVSVSGNGSVNSFPFGIDCRTDCSSRFDSGSFVELFPVADNGNVFTGWEKDCSGLGAVGLNLASSTSTISTSRGRSRSNSSALRSFRARLP